MNHKKLISLLCAAAMSISALTGIVFAEGETTEGSAAAIENTVTFDFETADTTIAATDVRSMTTAVVDDATGGNGTKVLSIAGTSTDSGSSRFGLSTIDISEYTQDKAHVIVEYDAYISSDGRMTYTVTDAVPTAYGESGVFIQGITKSGTSGIVNVNTNAWVHTTVDVDLQAGTGTYTVTNGDATVSTGTITTTKTALTIIAFLSWSPNTSYIDNIKIQSGGVIDIPEPTPVATIQPEAPSAVEGSDISLIPDDSTGTLDDDWSDVMGETAQVLNHSTAMTAVTTENTAITAYNSDVNVRGKSAFAAYDVYLTPDSEISLTPFGNGGASQASTMKLTADKAGIVTVSAVSSKESPVAEEKLAHSTWYRVVVEVPQNGDAESTSTGALTYTVYRINPEDPSQTLEIAARITNLSSRGIATRALSSFGISVTGEVYLDNAVVYVAPQREVTFGYGEVEASYESGTITITDNSAGNILGSAVAVVAQKADGVLTSAKVYPLTFKNGVATIKQTLVAGDEVYIWEAMDTYKPLANVYVHQ